MGKHAKYSVDDCKLYANTRRGWCISHSYNYRVMKWKCEQNHVWEAPPNNIINRNNWCPYCSGKRPTIQEMQELAQTRNGRCLSSKYINSKTKLTWQCQDGHVWKSTPDNIKSGRWCPYCNINLTEEKCRFIFESLLDASFPRISRILDNKYQLDGYCSKLNLAFEYNGIQHYKRIKAWDTNDSFKQSQKTDVLKSKLCEKLGIIKIDIPYTNSDTDISLEQYIRSELMIKNVDTFGKIDWSKFKPYKSKLSLLRGNLKNRNIRCIAEYYPGVAHKTSFQCVTCGYIWKTKIYHVISGSGCPQCAGCHTYTIEDMQDIAKSRGGICLSDSYTNEKTKLEWKCQCGNVWSATPHNIKLNKWCPECGKKKRWETRRRNMEILNA